MKRMIWAMGMAMLAISLSIGSPVAALDPCNTHDCHNGKECAAEGCYEGCGSEGKCDMEN